MPPTTESDIIAARQKIRRFLNLQKILATPDSIDVVVTPQAHVSLPPSDQASAVAAARTAAHAQATQALADINALGVTMESNTTLVDP